MATAGRLGQAIPRTTLDTYAHRVPARDQALANRLDQVIDEAG